MTAQVAAMLDELMGKHRNVDPSKNPKAPAWDDEDTCKHFLVDYCPYDLFTNTRSDLGICKKVHDEKLKDEYVKSSRYGRMGYEEQFILFLQSLQNDIQRRINKNKARLELTQPGGDVANAHQEKISEKITVMSEKINVLLLQAEQLGAEGKVDEAQGVIQMCEDLKEEKERLLLVVNQLQLSQAKPMEVCEVCGRFLILGDLRVDEHFVGKQHLGYAKIADTIEKLQQRKRDERKKQQEKIEKEKEEREKAKKNEEQRREDERRKRKEKDRERRRSRSRSRSRSKRSKHRRSRSREAEKRSSNSGSKKRHSDDKDRHSHHRSDRSKESTSRSPRSDHLSRDSQRHRDDWRAGRDDASASRAGSMEEAGQGHGYNPSRNHVLDGQGCSEDHRAPRESLDKSSRGEDGGRGEVDSGAKSYTRETGLSQGSRLPTRPASEEGELLSPPPAEDTLISGSQAGPSSSASTTCIASFDLPSEHCQVSAPQVVESI